MFGVLRNFVGTSKIFFGVNIVECFTFTCITKYAIYFTMIVKWTLIKLMLSNYIYFKSLGLSKVVKLVKKLTDEMSTAKCRVKLITHFILDNNIKINCWLINLINSTSINIHHFNLLDKMLNSVDMS